MFRCITLCILLALLQHSALYGQASQAVHFSFGTEFFPANYSTARLKSPAKEEIVNDRYVRYIQSDRLLSTAERQLLSDAGVQILEYVQFGAYLVSFPKHFDLGQLAKFQMSSIIPVKPVWKLARSLREPPYGSWALRGDQLAVNVLLYPHVSIDDAVNLCHKAGLTILKTGTNSPFLQLLIPQENIENIAGLSFVQYMELLPPPDEPEDTRGRSLHRANLLDSDAPSGKKYNGEGVSVVVRDNGQLGPHIDFKGRLTNLSPNPPEPGAHGDGVAGILSGAGNLDPTKKGMAAGTQVFAIDNTSDFQDATIGLFLNEHATITNTSYSNGCNSGYTLASKIVDGQMFDYPTLTHVFSAGNSNGTNCGYGAGNQWGNITGGHKQGKNSISAANLLANAILDNTSSHGPAYDGRIKPDIAANGNSQASTAPNNTYQVFGGTSGAAPGIAGCLAQLTQAYKTLNAGQEPAAALLKNILLNTANDLGNAGPDFKYGWGHVNAGRALRLLETNQWNEYSIDNQSIITKTLNIPAGVRQAKVMIYWAESPASELAAKALVNDLDLRISSADGTSYLPWKLDATPDPVLLDLPATKGRDSLNNVEQVAIDNPPAGNYTVSITGTEVPLGPQTFFLSWQFMTDSITLTYPNGGEGFVPGETERIHWDAFGNTDNFVLRYTVNDGADWQTITTLNNTVRMYDWLVPNNTSGKVRVQVQRGSQSDSNDALFSIAPAPQNIVMAKVCPDSMTFTWTDINDTLSYDVYLLGQHYMELTGNTSSNTFTIPLDNASLEQWISVRCATENGLAGRRANAVRWPGGLFQCPQPDDIALVAPLSIPTTPIINCTAVTQEISIRLKNEGLNTITGATVHYQLDNGSIVTEPLPDILPGNTLDYTFGNDLLLLGNTNGTVRVWASYPADDYVYNDTLIFPLSFATLPVNAPFTETFEASTSVPGGWRIENPDADNDGVTWKLFDDSNLTGADGLPTRALFLDCFYYTFNGAEDYVYLVPLDLSNISHPGLTFDVAHAQYANGANDFSTETLRVEVFPNCDVNAVPVVVWQKSDPALATAPASTTRFIPGDASLWREELVSLQQFAGQSVFVRFASVNGYGNSLFLDNINLSDYEAPYADFTLLNDTICRNDTLYFEAALAGPNAAQYAWNFGIGASPSSATGPGPHAVRYPVFGDKTTRLIVSNGAAADTALQQFYVKSFPVPTFTPQYDNLTVTFNNSSQFADTYFWTFGDGTNSTESSPVHTYAEPGNYIVKLSATNVCQTIDKTSVIQPTTGVSDLNGKLNVQILPNPTDGDFIVVLNGASGGVLQLNLIDITGRLIKTVETKLNQSITTIPFQNLSLAKGVYQLNIRTESGFQAYSIVIQ